MLSFFNKDPEIFFNRHSMDFRHRFKSLDNVKSSSDKKDLSAAASEKQTDFISYWEHKKKVAQL